MANYTISNGARYEVHLGPKFPRGEIREWGHWLEFMSHTNIKNIILQCNKVDKIYFN